jgi:hypothetical protein
MSNEQENVVIERLPFGPVSVDGWKRDELAKVAGWKDETKVYSYVESLSDCKLERIEYSTFALPPDAIAGRLFDEDTRCDVRWAVHGAGSGRTLTAWITWEFDKAAADAGGTKAEAGGTGGAREEAVRICRPYYLIGKYDSLGKRWREGRYPMAQLQYPVEFGAEQSNASGVRTAPVQDDRARIWVAEYSCAKPRWSAISGADQIERLLNSPRIFAHRFIRVDAGQDKDDARQS